MAHEGSQRRTLLAPLRRQRAPWSTVAGLRALTSSNTDAPRKPPRPQVQHPCGLSCQAAREAATASDAIGMRGCHRRRWSRCVEVVSAGVQLRRDDDVGGRGHAHCLCHVGQPHVLHLYRGRGRPTVHVALPCLRLRLLSFSQICRVRPATQRTGANKWIIGEFQHSLGALDPVQCLFASHLLWRESGRLGRSPNTRSSGAEPQARLSFIHIIRGGRHVDDESGARRAS
jgi:hypothetical protein